jgi:DNA mismatch repair protein MutL
LPDIIQLLPDNIANQIAAGEVIQRPASAVKELMENAVDSGASEVRLIVLDAGKALVQVIDNGKGMSETDARMSFERHATSKISNIDDLFRIRTMGFRGEALASIAAVAQVELKTRRVEDEVGTYVEIENSQVVKQEPVAFPAGTSIAMKNVFFNVPARRNFLKSNASEMRYIVDEFTRVAMAFPEIFFSLTSNGQQFFHLEKGSLKQRIIQLLGNSYNSKLVAVQEKTDYLNIYGFVGKPETSKKTRGDQYLFVNNRFIKSGYLNHAIANAYQDLIARESFPSYVLFIDLDPAQIDINVHPTKQEIKFEDEKIVYAFVQAAIKHALAQFSVTPSLEFDLDPQVQQLDAVNKPFTPEIQNAASSSALFRNFTEKNQAHFINSSNKSELRHWRDFYEPAVSGASGSDAAPFTSLMDQVKKEELEENARGVAPADKERFQIQAPGVLFQLHHTYLVAATDHGFLLVHQQLAHERVLYEHLAEASKGKPIASQRSLFPVTIEFSPQDAVMVQELLDDLLQLGYQLETFGAHTFVLQGTPADTGLGSEKTAIEQLLEQYKNFSSEIKFSKREKLLRVAANQQSIKPGKALTQQEMERLLERLFACAQPNISVNGAPTYIEFKKDYLEKLFSKA